MTADENPAGARPALARWTLYGVAATAGLAVSLWLAYRAGELAPADLARPPVGVSSPTPSTKLAFHRQARELPPLRFADGAGEPISLADFRGRVVLLNVWATWCTPCREEMPALDRLQARLGGHDFEVIALSLDQGDASVVHDFFREVGIERLQPYRDQYRETAATVGLTGVPLTLLVDREGRKIARKLGTAVWDHPKLVGQIEEQLGRSADVASATAERAATALVVQAAWARPTMPGQDVSAVYLTLSSAVDAELFEVRSDAADTVEIHDMTLDGGVMRMREKHRVPLPSGQAVRLQPGGMHLMMQQLTKPLLSGGQIALSLRWLDAVGREHVTRVDVPVRAAPTAGG